MLKAWPKLASEGKLRTLPRLSEKSEQKILKSIENYRQLTGRFLLNTADEIATKMTDFLAGLPGVEKVTPAGSLRRGRETVGDLDLLVTGKCCETDSHRNAVIERIVNFPGILEVLAKGEKQSEYQIAQRHAGGCAPASAGFFWRGDAILYWLKKS